MAGQGDSIPGSPTSIGFKEMHHCFITWSNVASGLDRLDFLTF